MSIVGIDSSAQGRFDFDGKSMVGMTRANGLWASSVVITEFEATLHEQHQSSDLDITITGPFAFHTADSKFIFDHAQGYWINTITKDIKDEQGYPIVRKGAILAFVRA